MLKIFKQIIVETINNIKYYFKNNMRYIIWIATIIIPYVMYYLGVNKAPVIVLIMPILFYLISYFIKCYLDKIGKGTSIPIPLKRFTDVSKDGEVSVEINRQEELILYVADLEDWFERKGLK